MSSHTRRAVALILGLVLSACGATEVEVATRAAPVEMPTQNVRASTTTTVLPVTTTTTSPPLPATTTTVAPEPEPKVHTARSGVNWDAIAQCESGGDWSANTGNGYYGGLQFHHDTWIGYGGGQFSENAHLTTRENQIAIASTMGLGHWPNCGSRG